MQRTSFAMVLVLALPVAAQSPPEFEVATVKLAAPDAVRNRVLYPAPDRLSIPSMSLQWLLYTAYQEGMGTSWNVSGGPDWTGKTAFAIEAKAPHPTTQRELRRMLRALLAERFALQLRHETRIGDVYALKLARSDGKLGPNIKEWDGTCLGRPPASEEDPFIPRCPSGWRPPGLFLDGAPMYAAADLLSLPQPRSQLGTIVQDQTGLTGRYTMRLDYIFTPRAADPAQQAVVPAPTLFDAVQEQWGMKLERAKGPLHMVVIEQAEPPTEN